MFRRTSPFDFARPASSEELHRVRPHQLGVGDLVDGISSARSSKAWARAASAITAEQHVGGGLDRPAIDRGAVHEPRDLPGQATLARPTLRAAVVRRATIDVDLAPPAPG